MAHWVNCPIIVSGRLTMTARRDHSRHPRMLNRFNPWMTVTPWIGDPIIRIEIPNQARGLTRLRGLSRRDPPRDREPRRMDARH